MMRACFLYPHPPPNSVLAQCRSQDSVVIPIFVAPRCPSHISFFRTAKNLKPSGSGKTDHSLEAVESSSPADGIGVLPDVDEDELCPVDCVREFNTEEEFSRILEKAKETHSLVVVDFYRTSCGSCKYIEQGFTKLCKGSGDEDAAVVFLKHNVIDEYDEQSEVAERLRIKSAKDRDWSCSSQENVLLGFVTSPRLKCCYDLVCSIYPGRHPLWRRGTFLLFLYIYFLAKPLF